MKKIKLNFLKLNTGIIFNNQKLYKNTKHIVFIFTIRKEICTHTQ